MNPSPGNPIYFLRDLVKEYGDRRVLEVGSLEIRQGEVFALVGPSGSGKSTLLRLMNFLEKPTSGRLHFRGQECHTGIEAPIELRRKVTTVFQHPMLLNRSVWENVTFGLKLRGERNSKAQVGEALEQVGLIHLAGQRSHLLSGGEAQRVALARAIVLQPDVLLLDEPTANLDPYNVGLIESIIRRLNNERGMTLVLVTHNVFQARRLAHRVAFLLEGRFVEVAEVQQFFESPTDPRTAAFVRGDMVY
jgi:tungstate transport system ATP-binding protein